MKRIVLAAIFIPLAFAATPVRAAGQFDGEWKGKFVENGSDVMTSSGPEAVCGFREKYFDATVSDNRFVAIIDQMGTKREFSDSIGKDGRLSVWGRWGVSGFPTTMNVSGVFSGSSFVGRLYGSIAVSQITLIHKVSHDFQQNREVCRADVYLARAPSSVDEVEQAAKGGGASPAIQTQELARLRAEIDRQRQADQVEKRRAESESKRQAEELARMKAEAQQEATRGGGELKRQLAMLKDLKDEGLITQEEFASRKKAVLDRILGRKQAAKTVDDAELAKYANVNFGNYHALVIGIDDYKYLPKLKTAKNDAETVAKLLKEEYGFDVTLLTKASRSDIFDAFDDYRANLGEEDNLLIYYAGHGWLDEEGEQGYWLPVDAKEGRRSNWISNSAISTTLKALDAKHIMVVAESCFSGTLIRGLKISEKRSDYIQRMVQKRARVVMTSGGLEPVADLGGEGHSPFANAFIDVLSENNSVMDGTGMFSRLRRSVMLSADQTPEYSDARRAGHDGGDFLFVRRK